MDLGRTVGNDDDKEVVSTAYVGSSKSTSPTHRFDHGAPEVVVDKQDQSSSAAAAANLQAPELSEPKPKKGGWLVQKLRYFTTRDFWFIIALGQILALCITGTNTLTTLLFEAGTNIPAFQSFFNYVLLNFVYTGYTIYRYGIRGWGRMLWKDGWKCKSPPPFFPAPFFFHGTNRERNVSVLHVQGNKSLTKSFGNHQTSSSPSSTSKATTSPCWPTGTRRS